MSRTFRNTPFRDVYSKATRNRVVIAAVETPNNEKGLEQDRRINGYDCRGYGSICGAHRKTPRGYDSFEEVWRPRDKRSTKRLTSRVRRLIGQDAVRAELDSMVEA